MPAMSSGKRWFLFFLGLTIVSIAVISIVVVILYGKYAGFLAVYPYAYDMITSFGMNLYLARVFAIILTLGLWVAIFKFFLSFSATKRTIGFGMLVVFFIIHSLMLYWSGRVVTVDGTKPYCSVHQVTGEIQQFSAPVFDPLGQKAHLCTAEEIRQIAIQETYGKEIPVEEIEEWFDAAGNPLFYYYKDSRGQFHFRYRGGFAKTGQALKQVTPEVLSEIQGELEKQMEQKSGQIDKVKKIKGNWLGICREALRDFYVNFPFVYMFVFVLMSIIVWVILFKDMVDSNWARIGLISGMIVLNIIGLSGIDYSNTWSTLIMIVLILSATCPLFVDFFKGMYEGAGEGGVRW